MQRGQESPDAVKVRTLPVQVAAHLTRRVVSGDIEDGRAPSELDIEPELAAMAAAGITNEASAALRGATADHTEVYEALVARDPAGARAAMRRHLCNNSTLLAEKEEQTKLAARRR